MDEKTRRLIKLSKQLDAVIAAQKRIEALVVKLYEYRYFERTSPENSARVSGYFDEDMH